jgi:hypothetical protein
MDIGAHRIDRHIQQMSDDKDNQDERIQPITPAPTPVATMPAILLKTVAMTLVASPSASSLE